MSLPPKTTETSEDPLTVSEVRSRVLQPAEKYGEFPGNNTLEFLIPYSTVWEGFTRNLRIAPATQFWSFAAICSTRCGGSARETEVDIF